MVPLEPMFRFGQPRSTKMISATRDGSGKSSAINMPRKPKPLHKSTIPAGGASLGNDSTQASTRRMTGALSFNSLSTLGMCFEPPSPVFVILFQTSRGNRRCQSCRTSKALASSCGSLVARGKRVACAAKASGSQNVDGVPDAALPVPSPLPSPANGCCCVRCGFSSTGSGIAFPFPRRLCDGAPSDPTVAAASAPRFFLGCRLPRAAGGAGGGSTSPEGHSP
mmetsp:Transcript_146865/g.366262  ORF Transcript_146865/g.366262 Transcript_146865/m.366262 type:complete len:223 (+) Transcript_146865:472-1140(+)